MQPEKYLSQFIEHYQIPLSICDDLLKFYEESKDKRKGVVVKANGENVINEHIKCSIEVVIPVNTNEIAVQNYFAELQKTLCLYIDKYPYCNAYAPFTVLG